LPVAVQAARAGFPLFLEKPLGDRLEDARLLAGICAEKKLPVMVAFQLRFHPLLVELKRRLDSGEFGRILRAAFHFGEYLPGMHPYEDYRQTHMARRAEGGGVIHCLSHELDLVLWLAGVPGTISAHGGKLTGLEHDVEDFVDLTATIFAGGTPSAVVAVHLNFWQSPPQRHFSLITETATIDFDYFKAALVIRHREKPEEIIQLTPFVRNEMFLAELRHYAECLETGRACSPGLGDGMRALQLADAAHTALREQRQVAVS
jgi:predicted dehydrogenase